MRFKEFKEFNAFTDAVPLFKNKTELSIWLFAIRNAKSTDINWQVRDIEELRRNREVVRAISVVDLEKVIELIAKYRDGKENLSSKNKTDRLRYLEKILVELKKKALFKMPIEVYKRSLERIGFDYLLDRYDFEDKEYTLLFPFESIDFGLRTAKFYFTERVAPFVLEIKKWFTLLDVEEFLALNSINSQLLYRFLKRKLGIKQDEFTLNLETLNRIFNTKYKHISDFKKYVLKPALEEINQKTSLSVEIKDIRRGLGGKTIAIKFKVRDTKRDITLSKFLNDEDFALKWLIKVLESLAKDLGVSYFQLLNELMELRRVKKGMALWYLLNFPRGEARLYAWKQVKITDMDKEIKVPDKFLEKLIIAHKKELNFLKDERVEALINKILKKLSEKNLENENDISEDELRELLGI